MTQKIRKYLSKTILSNCWDRNKFGLHKVLGHVYTLELYY